MDYCLINEAWDTKISNNFNEYMYKNNNNDDGNDVIENFTITKDENKNCECNDINDHIHNCENCKKQLYDHFINDIINIIKSKIKHFVDKNKDTLLIILSIFVFFLIIDIIKK